MDQAHGFEVVWWPDRQSSRYFPYKWSLWNVQGIAHKAFREECGMFEIDNEHVTVVGDHKVARFDVVITEAYSIVGEVNPLV